jgi:hypothetical protein
MQHMSDLLPPMSFVTRMLRRSPRSEADAVPLPGRSKVAPRLDAPQYGNAPKRNGAVPAGMGVQAEPQHLALREVFTPTRPQRSSRRVSGRQTELLRIFRAIALDRAHVVLYGERGRGKTSLVNLVASAARSSGYMVGRYTCSFDSRFEDIVRGLARDLPKSMLAAPMVQDDTLEGCEAALPKGKLQPRDIAALPGRLAGRHVVLIADEFDRVEDSATRTWFADAIKQASDRGAAISLLIVGVSDSLEELVGRHPSIQRNILGLALPLLSDAEIDDILVQGGRDAGMEFMPEVRSTVVDVARGVPYVAQLLGLHAGTEAVARDSARVEGQDLYAAFQRAVDEADPRVATIYQGITQGERDRATLETLRAIASGKQDRFARFVVSEHGGAFHLAERRLDPDVWSWLIEAGTVRACRSVGPDTYAFVEPMLQHYVLMREAIEYGVPA